MHTYEMDEQDRVVELRDLPQSSVGSPISCVLADEQKVVLGYYLEERDPNWDGRTIPVVGPSDVDEPIALVRFRMEGAGAIYSPRPGVAEITTQSPR